MLLKTCHLLIFILTVLLNACAKPYIYPTTPEHSLPQLYDNYALMEDGYRLPVHRWESADDSKAIILAIHGLNDYGPGFTSTGSYLATKGITLISYDQRGFGATMGHGYWHGSQRLIDDSRIMLRLIRDQFPEKPMFLVGESMGGAIVLATLNKTKSEVSGAILIAPAIWSRQSMPWYQRTLLWIATHTVPAKKLTGEGLDLMPSDNLEMLRALGEDPLVIKATRVDVLYGVTNLMDIASDASSNFTQDSLILYGKHDQIVPRKPTCTWLNALPDTDMKQRKIIIYENGYHMLNRDMQAQQVLDDIANWIQVISNDGKDIGPNKAGLSGQLYENESFATFCKGPLN